MEESFLANLQQEGVEINPEETAKEATVEKEKEEKETPPVSPAEKEPPAEPASPAAEEEPKKGEEEPAVFSAFHEHPRWIAREQELDELKRQNADLQEFKKSAEPILSRFQSEKEGIPQEFAAIYGNDENAWKNFQALSKRQQNELLDEVRKELAPLKESIAQTKKQTESEQWADTQWQAFESDAQVQKELKTIGRTLDNDTQNEIIGVLKKYRPTDEQGNLSIKGGFEIWKGTVKPVAPKPSVAEKKKLGDIDTKGTAEPEAKDYRTSADFRGKTFADLR